MEISSFFRIIKLQVIFHRFSTFDHVGGYVQISDNKSTKLKKIPILLLIYKCMSLYFILLNQSVSVTLSSLTLPENKKLRNYVTVREEKIKFIRWALLTFLCKIWSNPQKTRTKSLPFNISQEVSTFSEYNKNFFQHLMAT